MIAQTSHLASSKVDIAHIHRMALAKGSYHAGKFLSLQLATAVSCMLAQPL